VKQFLSSPKTDLAFAKDDANRFLPWIIAFMAFITSLILAGWISLHTVINEAEEDQSLAFTVHIPATTENITAQAQKALTIVQATKGVASAELMKNADMLKLVSPWLGNSDSLSALPLPVLIEATQKKPDAVNFNELSRLLKNAVSGTEIETHAGWMESYAASIASLRFLTLCIALLFLVMLGCIVTFTAKTSVRLHGKAVHILHSIGAMDSYIAKQFQINVGILSLKGAVIGCFCGALLYAILGWTVSHVETPLLPHFVFLPSHALLFLVLPILVVAIAVLATRFTVMGQLQQKP
jgi:cell division transport system permease protein